MKKVKTTNIPFVAEVYANKTTKFVLKCRIKKESIAHLGLCLGFIEGYNYAVKNKQGKQEL